MMHTGASVRHQSATTAKPLGVVAVVDDDSQILSALGMWLKLHGLRASRHTSAESLLLAIHLDEGQLFVRAGGSATAQYPLLGAVVDLNLPGSNGVTLAHSLRGLVPHLPVVIVTALQPEEWVAYGDLPSGVHCLKKPFDLERLEMALFPLLD